MNYISGVVDPPDAKLHVDGVPIKTSPDGTFISYLPVPGPPAHSYQITVTRGPETLRLRHPIGEASFSDDSDTLGKRRNPSFSRRDLIKKGSLVEVVSPTKSGPPDELVGRSPNGTYDWPLLSGTRGVVVSALDAEALVEIARDVRVWVKTTRLRLSGNQRPAKKIDITEPVRLVPSRDYAELRIPIERPPTYRIIESRDGVTLRLFDVDVHDLTKSLARPADSLINDVRPNSYNDTADFHVKLSAPLYGYVVTHRDGIFTLRIRRIPRIDREKPLHGLVIAVDAGHPPAGATGPRGTREHVVTLALAKRVAAVLRSKGATPLLTRSTDTAVSLLARVAAANSRNVHAFVSIHADAIEDGADPYGHDGTSTFAFHLQSLPVATAIHWSVTRTLSLKDRGIRHGDYAVLRPTWYPSVLCEAATLSVPEHEALLNSAHFQSVFAEAVVSGLEQYFLALKSHDSTTH